MAIRAISGAATPPPLARLPYSGWKPHPAPSSNRAREGSSSARRPITSGHQVDDLVRHGDHLARRLALELALYVGMVEGQHHQVVATGVLGDLEGGPQLAVDLHRDGHGVVLGDAAVGLRPGGVGDRKSTRLNSSH